MKKRWIAASLFCIFQTAAAENAMLVLDASGSMWAQIDGKTKIEIARSAVADMLKTWPQGHQLGLVAYGHRRKGDCADIETLLPVAALEPAIFKSKVDALNPKGMTPISAAVQHAAAALKSSEQKATVILVSDGEETCNLDPCAVAKQLEADGIDFTAHVIGFDVAMGSLADRQLQCLASETGGKYLNASNAIELNSALDQLSEAKVQEKVQEKVEEKVEEKPKATLIAPDQAQRGSTLLVSWTGPDAELDSIIISELGGKDRQSYVYVKDGNPASLVMPLKPGKYELQYRFTDAHTIATRAIEVTDLQVSLDAPAQAPVSTDIEVRWTGPDAYLDTIVIAKVGDDGYESYAYVSSGNPISLTTPSEPGKYELRYKFRDSEVAAVRAIEVTSR